MVPVVPEVLGDLQGPARVETTALLHICRLFDSVDEHFFIIIIMIVVVSESTANLYFLLQLHLD